MKNKPNKARLIIAIIVGITIGTSFSMAVVFSKTAVHGKFPAGTMVAAVSLADKTKEESEDILNKKVEEYLNKKITIKYLKETIEFSPEELGVEFLVKETLNTISQTNAKKIGIIGLFTQEEPIKKNLSIINNIDYDKLKEVIEKEFFTKELEPKSAEFYFNEKGKLEIKEETEGFIINTEKLFEDIKKAANNLEETQITLNTIKKKADITKEMLLNQEEEIKEQLNQTITLVDPIYSDDWYLNLKKNLDWIEFVEKERLTVPYLGQEIIIDKTQDGVNGETFVAISINTEKLNTYIDENISEWLDRPAEDVTMYLDPEGGVIIEGKGSSGKKVQRALFKDAIEKAIAFNVKEVIIPVIDLEPEIIIAEELQELGIKEKIAVGHTSYYGSPNNRVHNIKTGASKFNGLLIEPGETFSFNQNLGSVDGRSGYKKEKVIKKEGTIPEYGGGLCQVSTTMYRAVLLGGLSVKERNEHSYAVSYYSQTMGHGLDATIYLGGSDLKFENNTENHILIQTYTENDYELYVVFYGTQDGRDVELEGPYISNYRYPGGTVYIDSGELFVGETKQVEKPHTGFDVIWYRHSTTAEGLTETETIETNYQAVPTKIWVGTKEREEEED